MGIIGIWYCIARLKAPFLKGARYTSGLGTRPSG
jgi:hypothetical protein